MVGGVIHLQFSKTPIVSVLVITMSFCLSAEGALFKTCGELFHSTVSAVTGIFSPSTQQTGLPPNIENLRLQRQRAFVKGNRAQLARFSSDLASFLLAKENLDAASVVEAVQIYDSGHLERADYFKLENALNRISLGGRKVADILKITEPLAKWTYTFEEMQSRSTSPLNSPSLKLIGSRIRLVETYLKGEELGSIEPILLDAKKQFLENMLEDPNPSTLTALMGLRFFSENPHWDENETVKLGLNKLSVEGIPARKIINTLQEIDSPGRKTWENAVRVLFQCVAGEAVSVAFEGEFGDYLMKKQFGLGWITNYGGSAVLIQGGKGKKDTIDNLPISQVASVFVAKKNDHVLQFVPIDKVMAFHYEVRNRLLNSKEIPKLIKQIKKDSGEAEDLLKILEEGNLKVAEYHDGLRAIHRGPPSIDRMAHLLDFLVLKELKKGNRIKRL